MSKELRYLILRPHDESRVLKSDSAESDEIVEEVTGESVDDTGKASMATKSHEQLLKEIRAISDPMERLEKCFELETDPAEKAHLGKELTRIRLAKQIEEQSNAGNMGQAIQQASADAIANATAPAGTSSATGRDEMHAVFTGTAPVEDIDWSPELDAQMTNQIKKSTDPVEKDRISYEQTLARLKALHRGERPY